MGVRVREGLKSRCRAGRCALWSTRTRISVREFGGSCQRVIIPGQLGMTEGRKEGDPAGDPNPTFTFPGDRRSKYL